MPVIHPGPGEKKSRTREVQEKGDTGGKECVDLWLYVTNETPRCLAAYENIKKICEEYAGGKYRITVIDLLKNPGIARRDDITAIPTLVRVSRTKGRCKIIGILSDVPKVLAGLDLMPEAGNHDRNTGRLPTRTPHRTR
jgi:circadian clock protein KaiB